MKIFIYLFISSVFSLFRAAPAAYGGSQARRLIRAVAPGATTSLTLNNKERKDTYTLMMASGTLVFCGCKMNVEHKSWMQKAEIFQEVGGKGSVLKRVSQLPGMH